MSDPAVRAVQKTLHEGKDAATACGSQYDWESCPICECFAELVVEWRILQNDEGQK